MNISIGQGYLTVTPIQVANLVSMIVNEGTVYTPHVLKEVRDPISGNIIEDHNPEVMRRSNIRRETFKTVKKAMRGVISEGTASSVITTDAVKIAGKTGTGQVGFEDRWSSWFTAYGPYNAGRKEDQLVVVVMVEGTNEWEWWAPKAANIIFQAIFASQSYEEAMKELDIWYMRETQN
jgi:penicillin-binding protein 2